MIAALLATVAAAGVPFPTAVGVSAREFRFGLYRDTVPAGKVALNVHNFGEDDHDVQVKGPRGFASPVSPDIDPGATVRVELRLRRPGRYTLICTKPGHLAAGMKATLRVREPHRAAISVGASDRRRTSTPLR